MRVAIVENTRITHHGQVGVALHEQAALIDLWKPWADDRLPTTDTADALVVFGGEQAATDDHTHPYLPALADLMGRDEFTVERMTKTGLRTFDVRSAILTAEVTDDVTIRVRTVHQTPLVRPDDIVSALRRIDEAVPGRPLLTRLAQGPLRDGAIGDPLR